MQKRYTIPRFNDLSLIVLTYGPFNVTARQLCITVVAAMVAMNLWHFLQWFALVPALLIVPFGWIMISGRPLEAWVFLLLRYWLSPKRYTWVPRTDEEQRA